MKPRPARTARAGGFSLLELSVALAVLILLAAGIFSLAGGALELLEDVQGMQERENRKRRFIELCRQNFESLPAGAEVSFRYEARGGHYDTYLSLRGAPSAFGFGRGDAEVRRVILAAEVDSSGYIRSTVYHLDEEADERYARGDTSRAQARSLLLMTRLRQLTWRFFDQNTREWRDTWPEASGNPVMVELTLAGEGEAEPARAVFWVPARQAAEMPVPPPGEERRRGGGPDSPGGGGARVPRQLIEEFLPGEPDFPGED